MVEPFAAPVRPETSVQVSGLGDAVAAKGDEPSATSPEAAVTAGGGGVGSAKHDDTEKGRTEGGVVEMGRERVVKEVGEVRAAREEAMHRRREKAELRGKNLNAATSRLDVNLKLLDASIKKNEAMVKKLRMVRSRLVLPHSGWTTTLS